MWCVFRSAGFSGMRDSPIENHETTQDRVQVVLGRKCDVDGEGSRTASQSKKGLLDSVNLGSLEEHVRHAISEQVAMVMLNDEVDDVWEGWSGMSRRMT